MRIAVLGDFHISKSHPELSRDAMDDIAACRPDLVVPLGDFGSPGLIGSPAGLEESHALLQRIGASVRPILGNHDLQRESGGGPQQPGTMNRTLLELFDLDAPYGVLEYEDFRLAFITTDYQPPEICYQIQECYTSDEQYLIIEKFLDERPGVPVIVFSHAPPIGCGLRTVPNTHVRATNAFLSQNHQPA